MVYMQNELNTETPAPRLRLANSGDALAIAALHADSWRRHYRGAYSDSFLDGNVLENRMAVWSERLAQLNPDCFTVVADIGNSVIGFAHVVLDQDQEWGALLDNLHVTYSLKGRGIGTRLLAHAARELIERHPSDCRLYLWVLEQNRAAQSFYIAHGGVCVEKTTHGPVPGGGTVRVQRIAWSDARSLASPEVT